MVFQVAGSILRALGIKPSERKRNYVLAKKVLSAGDGREHGVRTRLKTEFGRRRRNSVSSMEFFTERDENGICFAVETRILGKIFLDAENVQSTQDVDDGLYKLRELTNIEMLLEENIFYKEPRVLRNIDAENIFLDNNLNKSVQVNQPKIRIEDQVLIGDFYKNRIYQGFEQRENVSSIKKNSVLLLTFELWDVIQARRKRSQKRRKGKFKLVCTFGFNLMYAR
eukprot:snap_masked-scaffold_2-processed-gene-14.21-mRNA-1 protein AED:1.00 eAED:1.00 QI:0/-1/0/0/-1/1/1/0/224